MKKIILIATVFLSFISCDKQQQNKVLVQNKQELNKAIHQALPGTQIVLANGIWKDVEINFYGMGTKENPIVLKAETPGKVFLEGNSYLFLGGEHLTVDGLYFKNGYSPKSTIIRFMINNDSIAYNCRITNTVIKGFTKPSRLINDHWIEFYGKHNKIDHNYISGKSNDGETVRVFYTGNEHIKNYHQIVDNYFGPRPRKGGARAETIRIGDSKTRVSPSFANISNNYFDACNGEVEIISDKTNFNTFKNNIFYKCEGSLVLRHGSYAKVDGNLFIGGDDSDFYGGIRVVNTGHLITNNYFYKINGSKFRTPLAIMNGIPMTPLNRYKQVTDVVIAYNTWVDCKSPIQVGVGQNIKSADVLPPSEIRSAPPIRSIFANNLIYNTKTDPTPFINHSNMEGIQFKNNLIDNNGTDYNKNSVLQDGDIKMEQINNWLFAPVKSENNILNSVYMGYQFDEITTDLFDSPRSEQNRIGAITNISNAKSFSIDKNKYGPSWYAKEKELVAATIITIANNKELANALTKAKDGDILELTSDTYMLNASLKIDKNITIRSKSSDKKTTLVFTGTEGTPAFEMNPNGSINLENINLQGTKNTYAFSPLKENMSAAYKLSLNQCEIKGFDHILLAYKGSFADSINLTNTSFKNCTNGIVLAADEKGDYNAEMVKIDTCEFDNIQNNVIHFYRGGYDESTIGGCLTISNSRFTNSGQNETSKTLLKTRGIINVNIHDNTFENNPVELVALLWGVKNNHHNNNTFVKSGTIKVEEQQKLKILY